MKKIRERALPVVIVCRYLTSTFVGRPFAAQETL
jgi:hypothetical protein